MNIEKVLKMEGIDLVSTIDKKKIDYMANKISSKICNALPEHNLNKYYVCDELAKVNMYYADFKNQSIGAKYYFKNKSMYFNRSYSSKKLSTISIHESIHFIQEKRNPNNTLNRFGLYKINTIKPTGLNLNEAAVQLMTVNITKSKPDYVKYYGLNFYTPSPDYYPIECALLNQIAYFTGTYPLFHSTLYSDDVFKTTLITKTNKRTYRFIENAFDYLADYQDKLSKLLYTLSNCNNEKISKSLNIKIEQTKSNISDLAIKTQEIILTEIFKTEIANAKTLDTITEIRNKLLGFKNLLIQNEKYDFYDLFSCTILGQLDEKEKFIKDYGIQYYFKQNSEYLPISATDNYGIDFFKKLLLKTKKLFTFDKNKEIKANNS